MTKKQKYFSIEETNSIAGISSPAINIQGTMVTYLTTSTDWDINCYINNLWLYDAKKDCHLQLTSKSEGNCRSPIWSPDGKFLAYLRAGSDNDVNTQIFIINLQTLEKNQISHAEDGVTDFIWSADSKGFYYLSKSPEAQKIKDRNKKYGEFRYVDDDKENNSLYYLDLGLGLEKTQVRYNQPEDLRKQDFGNKCFPAVLLTKGQRFFIVELITSADNCLIAFTAAPSTTSEGWDNLGLYIYDTIKKELNKIEIEEFAGNILFSPDSKQICYSKGKSRFLNNKIESYDLLSRSFKIYNTGIDEQIKLLQWTTDGIYFFYLNRTDSVICLLADGNKFQTILFNSGTFYSSFQVTPDGKNKIYFVQNSNNLTELYFNSKKITYMSSVLKNRKISKKEIINWTNNDGIEIEGILTKPADYDENRKYPLLVYVHGGPRATSCPHVLCNERFYPIESLVEKGLIILEPNYRGSAGYGEKFRSSNFRNLGICDYEDVISGVDYLIAQGYADREKIGVMGWSQGGYISAFCATYSDRFKAISVGAGISNWETYFYSTRATSWTKEYLGDYPFNEIGRAHV